MRTLILCLACHLGSKKKWGGEGNATFHLPPPFKIFPQTKCKWFSICFLTYSLGNCLTASFTSSLCSLLMYSITSYICFFPFLTVEFVSLLLLSYFLSSLNLLCLFSLLISPFIYDSFPYSFCLLLEVTIDFYTLFTLNLQARPSSMVRRSHSADKIHHNAWENVQLWIAWAATTF